MKGCEANPGHHLQRIGAPGLQTRLYVSVEHISTIMEVPKTSLIFLCRFYRHVLRMFPFNHQLLMQLLGIFAVNLDVESRRRLACSPDLATRLNLVHLNIEVVPPRPRIFNSFVADEILRTKRTAVRPRNHVRVWDSLFWGTYF